jgi:hypothetical protein
VLVAAILTFRLCRPNREVYQSDDDQRTWSRGLPSVDDERGTTLVDRSEI